MDIFSVIVKKNSSAKPQIYTATLSEHGAFSGLGKNSITLFLCFQCGYRLPPLRCRVLSSLLVTYSHARAATWLLRVSNLPIKVRDSRMLVLSECAGVAVKFNALWARSEVYTFTYAKVRGILWKLIKNFFRLRETVFINQFSEGPSPRYVI
jgi:hypothetical protein